ncbi:hypothetical protein FH969_02475 [Miniimonas arenae]|uniref:Uncharacterized protein n=1 Tax=Miniimonas arenae TaxID=676201 RepID=A0A5C5BES4_9MICO|nr:MULTISPECIES: hypothetical protein [Miniimonas]TNU76586.1 hypothetical protein FH969_02475 [Miniimonas arenae]
MTNGVDWGAFGRGGTRAVARPSLVVLVIAGVCVGGLVLATLSVQGFGAWVLRFVALLLAVPVVWLAVRRHQVLGRLGEMERTGEHPDNVVHTRTPDGQEVTVVVSGAETSVVPRTGIGGLTALAFASLASAGISFGILVIIGIAALL